MADSDQHVVPIPADARTVVIQLPSRRIWPVLIVGLLLFGAIIAAGLLMTGAIATAAGFGTVATDDGVDEVYEEGATIGPKLAIIEMSGTIGPPFTSGWLDQIEKAREDDDVKGLLLHVDSPGGFVADSHQIFHELRKLSGVKPVVVQFGRLAASGGYYVAMGAGPESTIFAEPTTWTGSIGVIVPYYNAEELADKVGVRADPLKTGRFKDTLSPFREPSEAEQQLWDEILADAFDRFKSVIEIGRPDLDRAEIDDAATGQIFTAEQALSRGLIDEIGFRDDAIAKLKERAGVQNPRVIRYESPSSPLALLLGQAENSDVSAMLKAARPEAFYLYGWPATLLPR